jgi:hypothetical protein
MQHMQTLICIPHYADVGMAGRALVDLRAPEPARPVGPAAASSMGLLALAWDQFHRVPACRFPVRTLWPVWKDMLIAKVAINVSAQVWA